jgi:hypothetical protein
MSEIFRNLREHFTFRSGAPPREPMTARFFGPMALMLGITFVLAQRDSWDCSQPKSL